MGTRGALAIHLEPSTRGWCTSEPTTTGPPPHGGWHNPLTEIHRSGVTVVNDPDVEWFTWSPRTQTIGLQPEFGPVFKRGTVTLALAHRALGYWGMSTG